jgi:hypothetical protein
MVTAGILGKLLWFGITHSVRASEVPIEKEVRRP